MNNLNPYDQEEFEQEFRSTELFARLSEDHDYVLFDKHHRPDQLPSRTPREVLANRVAMGTTFYYLEKLMGSSPVHDIGPGSNFFGRYYPQIIPEEIWFDRAFARNNPERYPNLMAINSLHFIPIERFKDRIDDVVATVQPGGKIFLTFNLDCMIQDNGWYGQKELALEYIRAQLDDVKDVEWIVIDIIEDSDNCEDGIDGSVRLLFQKVKSHK